MSLKTKFTQDYSQKAIVKAIVVAIQLPSGSVEIITNYEDLENKYLYYLETYNEDMKKYENSDVRVIDWMIL